MKIIRLFTSVLSIMFLATHGFAGTAGPPPVTPPAVNTPGSNDDTSLFVGLNWGIGSRGTLEGVVGVIHSNVDAGGDVEGGRLSMHFDLLGRDIAPNVRLTGILGDEDIAGEAGLGLGFDGTPFGILGGIGNHYNFGGTLGFDGSAGGYIGTHSYGEFNDKPTAPAPAAPPNPQPSALPIQE
ncbi:hypothetical protein FDP25_01290 [Roseovarius sp. A21]|uniref:Uncharacterized protein n=2 Tax=Roseovarius bejariae TaxID=2576383 RepID=A0A844CS45_9RHOB|nr:hypothetical protein [Roseovarius bejariae]